MSERGMTRLLVVGLVIVVIVLAVSRLGGGAMDALRRLHGH